MSLTKQDLDSIKDIVDSRLNLGLAPIKQDISIIKNDISGLREDVAEIPLLRKEITELKKDVGGLREQIQELSVTLDRFVKMMTDYGEEFILLKGEVDQIKEVLLEKFGIKIATQGVSVKK